MMNVFFTKIKSFLPLNLENCSWIYPNLQLSGEGWIFQTKSAWHLMDSEKLLCGCYDDIAEELLNNLLGLSITAINLQSLNLPIDPVFVFSNGQKIKFFTATSANKCWTFSTRTGEKFECEI